MVAESPEDDSGAMPRLHSLTGLRFYAALAIVLRHTVPPIMGLPWLTQIVAVGPVGVGFFFVLSGFVLTWGYRPGVARAAFYMRRVARIYPLHVVTTLAAVGVALLLGQAVHPGSAALSLTLLQSWFPDSWRHGGNEVSWSLSCEAFFYACFPFLIVPLRRLERRAAILAIVGVLVAMGVYVVAYVAVSMASGADLNALSPYSNPAYRIGQFVIGILIARLLQRGVRAPVSLNVMLGVTGVALILLSVLNMLVVRSGTMGGAGLPLFVLDLLFLPVASLLIFVAATSDLAGRPTVLGRPAHVALGQWSFALYLVHPIMLTLVLSALPAGSAVSLHALVLGGLVVGSVALSGVAFRWIEVPCEKWIRNRYARAA